MMVKRAPAFPVRGVPGGWKDEWSGPDPAETMQQQFAAWEAMRSDRVEQLRQASAGRSGSAAPGIARDRAARTDAPPA